MITFENRHRDLSRCDYFTYTPNAVVIIFHSDLSSSLIPDRGHMFYKPSEGHGLPHNPFNAIITPRPIAWVSSQDTTGCKNLAPYSFFNGIAYDPPQIMFASTSTKQDQAYGKDSIRNAHETGVFCVNVVEFRMRDAMNHSSTSFPKNVDEFAQCGVTSVQCETIDCPRIADAPAALECKLVEYVPLRGEANVMVIGEVVGVHIRDDCIYNGRFDITHFEPLGRLGYRDYVKVSDVFELLRPDDELISTTSVNSK